MLECGEGGGQAKHGSVFNVEFYPETRKIRVEESWVCGSVDGVYS